MPKIACSLSGNTTRHIRSGSGILLVLAITLVLAEKASASAPLTALSAGLTKRHFLYWTVVIQEQNQSRNNSDQNSASLSGPTPLTLDDLVARDILEPLQGGMQGHSLKQVLNVFDQQSMTDYASLRDQLRAMFQNYSMFLFRYKLLQLTSDDDRASATCEIDLDATPVDDNALTLRRSVQMRLDLKHTAKGWRILAFSPSDFFAR